LGKNIKYHKEKHCSKDAGVEVNAEETKNMLCLGGRNHNINIANNFEMQGMYNGDYESCLLGCKQTKWHHTPEGSNLHG
jgi:hypothetical protein